jgi:hypothetical protein
MDMLYFNPTMREMLAAVIAKLAQRFPGADGKEGDKDKPSRLSVEQFLVVLKHINMGLTLGDAASTADGSAPAVDSSDKPPPVPAQESPRRPSQESPLSSSSLLSSPTEYSVGMLVLCRFVDRDGDGFISCEDVLAAQALILNRSEELMRTVFRIYVEAVWYPGRQLNLKNHVTRAPLKSNGGDQWQRGWDYEASGGGGGGGGGGVRRTSAAGGGRGGGQGHQQSRNSVLGDTRHVDAVEPPKFITSRHVSAVFERLGYEAASGAEVFQLLWEAVAQSKGGKGGEDSGRLPTVPASPRESIVEEEETATGESSPSIVASAATATASQPNAALVAAFGGTAKSSGSGSGGVGGGGVGGGVGSSGSGSGKGSGKSGASSSGEGGGGAVAATANMKLDFTDFCKGAEIDDVLVQALFRQARSKLQRLVKQAESQYFTEQETLYNDNKAATAAVSGKGEGEGKVGGQSAADTSVVGESSAKKGEKAARTSSKDGGSSGGESVAETSVGKGNGAVETSATGKRESSAGEGARNGEREGENATRNGKGESESAAGTVAGKSSGGEGAAENSAVGEGESSAGEGAETSPSEIAAALLVAELLEPFALLQRQEAALQQRYEAYPYARSVRLATESAFFGLTSTINRGVQSLIEARNETRGDGHFDRDSTSAVREGEEEEEEEE